jgi:cytoskeleton protein RodZ
MRSGKDLQDIARILHIRYNYLVAIEDGRFEDLPGQAYAIGFVRAYAEHLGLDGDEVVRRFKDENAWVRRKTTIDYPLPAPASGVPSGVLLLIAGADRRAADLIQEIPDRLAALLGGNEAEPPTQVADAATESTEAAPTVVTPAIAPAPEPALLSQPQPPMAIASADPAPARVEPGSQPPPSAPQPRAETAPASAPPATAPQVAALPDARLAAPSPPPASVPAATQPPPAQPKPAPAKGPADVIELRAVSDSWIQVRAGDQLLLTRLLRKGEVYRVPDRNGLTLMTGNAGGLEVLVNGTLMPPLGGEGTVARGVPLEGARLKTMANAAQSRPAASEDEGEPD